MPTPSLSVRNMVMQAYLWLAIPLIIWSFGWLEAWIAVMIACPVLFVGAYMFRQNFEDSSLSPVRIDGRYIISVLLLAAFVWISGIGGYSYQFFGDHSYRNAVFHTLVTQPWPVDMGTAESPSVLCYYFGFWLPAALTAKIAGTEAGWLMQFLYALWALVVAFNFIYARFGGKALLGLPLLFIFFSGWEVPGWILCHLVEGDSISLSGLIKSQKDLMGEVYAGNAPYADFFYIYNQSCTALVGCSLLYFTRRKPELCVFLWSLMFIGCVFPTIALAPVMAWNCLRQYRRTLSWQNITGVLIFAAVGLFYLSSPRAMSANHDFSHERPAFYLWRGALYLILIAGIYIPFVFKRIKHDAIFLTLFAVMAAAPFVSFAGTADMGWRMGIPFIFYLCYVLMEQLHDGNDRPSHIRAILLYCVIAIGALSPAFHYADVVRQTVRTHTDPAGFPPGETCLRRTDRNATLHDPACTPCYANFFADGNSIFTRYMMKR